MQNMTLRIENVATLENGGPTFLRLTGKSAQVGRKAGMDWVLPDPTRHISGHHFDVSYQRNVYFLHDVSTNGIFLQGEEGRLSGPRGLQQGDQFQVGAYTISVELTEVATSPEPLLLVDPSASSAMKTRRPIGSGVGVGNDPVAIKPVVKGSGALQTPRFDRVPTRACTAPQRPDLSSFAKAVKSENLSPPPQFRQGAAARDLVQSPAGQSAKAVPVPSLAAPLPKVAVAPAAVPDVAIRTGAPQPKPVASAHEDIPDAHFLQAFLEGAGVEGPDQLNLPPQEFGRLLGRCVRDATDEMMMMLQSRAAVKLFMSGEDRTMRLAAGNNPMKFMMETDRAFETMFLAPRDGYMTGADGFKNALADIRNHQDAVVAALQPALAEMLEGLSPDEIENSVDKGRFGGGSGKFWSEYKSRWEATASQGQNGMLDAFIKAFSHHYAEALRNSQV